MKVIHVAESFSAGILDFICYLTNELNQFEHVVIFGNREIKERNIELQDIKRRFNDSVTFIEWKYAERDIHPLKDLLAFYNLLSILKKFDYAALHLHSSKAGFLGRAAGPFLKNKNIYYTPHSAYFLRTDISKAKRKSIVLLEQIANHLSGKVVCCSKSEYEEFIKNNIPATYINNGIPVTDIPIKHSPKSKFTIATSGRTFHQKNPALFNKIASHFTSNPNIEFWWIGDGYLNHLLTSPNIKITGWVIREKVYDILQNSDLYLSTSLWEGLPYSVLDAMSLGKPLLLSNCTGNQDLVNNGSNGYLYHTDIEAADRIRYLLDNPELLSKFGDNSRKMCEESFNLKKTASLYAQLYLKTDS